MLSESTHLSPCICLGKSWRDVKAQSAPTTVAQSTWEATCRHSWLCQTLPASPPEGGLACVPSRAESQGADMPQEALLLMRGHNGWVHASVPLPLWGDAQVCPTHSLRGPQWGG